MRRRPVTTFSPTRDVATPTTRWVGRTFGPYRVRSVVEHDAESVTLLADERTDGRPRRVLLRCLERRAREDPDARSRFEREARICLALRHVNLVGGVGRPIVDGEPALALESHGGRQLGDLLRQARNQTVRVPPSLALVIVSRVAAGLDHAHRLTDPESSESVVHGAVRPETIYVSDEGDVRLTGFGREPKPESRPALLASLRYLAPEQAYAGETLPASDVYAVGVVLAEILGGGPLFGAGDPKSLLADIVRGRRLDMVGWLDFRATALAEALERALALRPEDRYPTASAFGWALERAMAQLGEIADESAVASFSARLRKSTGDLVAPTIAAGPNSAGPPDASLAGTAPPPRGLAAAELPRRPEAVTPIPDVRPPMPRGASAAKGAAPLEPERFGPTRRRPPPPAPPADPILEVAHHALGPEQPASTFRARLWARTSSKDSGKPGGAWIWVTVAIALLL